MTGQPLMVLTQADRDLIQRFLDEKRRAPVNTQGRGREGATEHEEWLTPEVYVARVPTLGIPALVGSADESVIGNDGDIPGYGDCYIYRILSTSGVPKLRKVSANRKRVYNLLGSILSDTPWVPIIRDKFGSWLALSGGVAGTGTDASTEPECGLLILNCPDDSGFPGTGSEVTVSPPIGSPPISTGFTSICNEGLVVPSRLYLTLTYGTASVTVPIVSTDGYSWDYDGPTVDVGTCGATFRLGEVVMYCTDRGWVLDLALYVPSLQAFGSPTDFPRPAKVTSDPFHYSTSTPENVTTGCGFEVIRIDVTQ